MIFFQHAAEVEKKQNASEVQKSMGSVIQYGITIQVSPSNFFLKSQIRRSPLNSNRVSQECQNAFFNSMQWLSLVVIVIAYN